MAELLKKIGSRIFDCRRRVAVNVFEETMPADDVQGGRIKLHRDEKAPLEPLRPLALPRRQQPHIFATVDLSQVANDCRAFGNGEIAILYGVG